jgi:polyhydroxyalkanoate synthesis regulator phasin
MAAQLRWLLFSASTLLLVSGCLTRRDPSAFPRTPAFPPDARAPKSRFAELQQSAESAADNKMRGQATSQNDSSGVRLTNWEEQAINDDPRPRSDFPKETPADAAALDNRNSVIRVGDGRQPLPALPGGGKAQPGVRNNPTALGEHLQLGPQELATERAVILSQLLGQSQSEAKSLREKITTLEQQIDTLHRTRPDLTPELEQATDELRRSRVQMESLHAEVAALRERLRRLDRQELDTLQEVITLLEQVGRDKPAAKSDR